MTRLRLFDAIRGFSVISMVLFHYCYDLKYLVGADLAWFAPPLQDVWRASISWVFIGLAGIMCALSRNNLRRALLYGSVALAIFAITSVASVDDPISFGVIYCMAACTLVAGLLEKLGTRPKGVLSAALLFTCFIFCLHISHGWVGFFGLRISLPHLLYTTDWLAWLGFYGPGFVSADYYPLLPYLFLYLSGASLGWYWKDTAFPSSCSTLACAPLEFVGRHALPIYLLHQPLLLLLCGLL